MHTVHRQILQLIKGSSKYLNPLIQNELISVLHVKSYAQGKRHLLSTKMKEVCLVRCKNLLNWLKGNGSTVKFFSDEKIFTVKRSFNKRNDCYIASSSSAVQLAMTTKHPASAMTIRIVSSEGDGFTHFLVPQEKVNAEVYSRF